MRPLAALERFFERIFERPSARLFRARIQPVQIQRRIERAMETDRLSGADRTLVPNRFRVRLNPEDLTSFGGMVETLAGELADGALAFARSHRYAVADRPRVDLVADPATARGDIDVEARFADPEAAAQAAPSPEPDWDAARSSSHTMVFQVPVADAPFARLLEIRSDGSTREVEVDGTSLTIGRASDNGLVLEDSRVSRHHGRLNARRGTLVYSDLGSTNGSRVNGVRVSEVVLGEGDRIEIGDTVLVVEALAG
ncbi:MAG TPA: DUF3662 and FHA domain-containing protein [Vitreimonas sp.]|nr:DUF3662 and FHA domain-containing protein [Vitreimonas sp.]